jgi:aminoglycoside phosphotransferase (APT) family kinase protein
MTSAQPLSEAPIAGVGNEPRSAHPALRRLFAALAKRELSWLLLRPPSNLAAPAGDVDILVAPQHAAALSDAAEAVGFVALPGWEAPPNLILARYDDESDHWLVLDVVTALFSPDAAAEVLRNREVRDDIVVPSAPDAFWLLLVHCLLDKRAIAPRYRRLLVGLAPAAAESALAWTVTSAAGGAQSPSALAEAVLRERWELVEEVGPRLAAGLRRGRIRALPGRAGAAARKPLLLPRRRGVSIALIGPNGVGKSTLAAELQRQFPFDARIVYMGLWKGGGRGAAAAVARPFRIWRRYLRAQLHQARGRLVIFDRYVYEAELPPKPPLLALKKPYLWLLAHAVPAANAVVLLDVDGLIAYARKQENPPEELEAERAIYRGLAARVPSLEIVDGSLDADNVRAQVMRIAWRATAARWQPRSRRRPTRECRRLAAACALVPRILAAEAAAPAGAITQHARMTNTRGALITLAPPGAPARAVIKLPLTAEGARELERERENLAALRADERLGDWRRLIPRALGAGAALGQPYLIESAFSGRAVLDRVADPATRRRILETAVANIRLLHERTASPRLVDSHLAERWIDARLEDLARSGAGRHPRFHSRARRLRDELGSVLIGSALTTSWVHGDYWPGNLLFSPADLELTGIVDWDAADPTDLPAHDLLHLVFSTRRLASGEQLGQIVRRQLRAPAFSPEERAIVGSLCDPAPERHVLLLYWLRHAALHARQNGCSGGRRYLLWEMRNVHAVLGAL